jgi:Fe-S-cluster formation regulator IscX/YfhJ
VDEVAGRGAAPERENEPTKSSTELKLDHKLLDLLRWAVEASEDDDGWANLGAIGAKIMSQQPDFDSRSYGFTKLSQLVEATGLFDVERQTSQTGRVDIFLREIVQPKARGR